LLLDAGCATNELTASDYGFDIHVLLPTRYPVAETKWPMSSESVLVQVKGGKSFDSGVKLSRETWRFYLRSPVPVYLAVVPASGDPWIELVDRLVNDLEATDTFETPQQAKSSLRRQPSDDRRWDPQLFVEDAILQAKLGSRARRRQVLDWARWREGADPELDFLLTLAELAVAETGDYTQIDSQVATYLDDLPGLVRFMQGGHKIGVGFHSAPDLSHLALAEHILDGEYLDGAGELESQANRLRSLIREFTGAIHARDLVLLANREHYPVDEYWENRRP
jgi:hypothetical protein